MDAERTRLRTRPLDRSANPRRTGQLRGGLATRRIGEDVLPQWQQEITSAGRLWYCPDKKTRTVWIVKVDLQHPKATDCLPDDGLRYELVDGNLVVTPPTQRHQWLGDALATQLRADAPDGWRVVTELRLPLEEDLRIPDVVVHRWPLQHPTTDRANPLGPRDIGLLVEMVSPRTRKTDRFTKPAEYAAAGVPLFWRLETDPVLVLHPYVLDAGSYVRVDPVALRGLAPTPWGEAVVDLGALEG